MTSACNCFPNCKAGRGGHEDDHVNERERTFMISLKGNDGDRKREVGCKDEVASSMHGQCRL